MYHAKEINDVRVGDHFILPHEMDLDGLHRTKYVKIDDKSYKPVTGRAKKIIIEDAEMIVYLTFWERTQANDESEYAEL